MTFDFSVIASDDRNAYIEEGRKYSSAQTLGQAHKTLNALTTHAARLVAHGFTAEDAADLSGIVAFLEGLAGGRESARSDKKTDQLERSVASRDARRARKLGRTLVAAAAARARRRGVTGPARATIEAALAQTKSAADDDHVGTHLSVLATELGKADVAALVGAPAATAASTATAAEGTLRAKTAATKVPRGTPEHTSQMDLADGVIVELVRQAYGAAKLTEDPAVIEAFRLTELKAASGSGSAKQVDATTAVPVGSAAGEPAKS